jgi:two-component system response regulator GlrR
VPIVTLFSDEPAALEAVAQLVRDGLGWTVEPCRWDEIDGDLSRFAAAQAWIVVGAVPDRMTGELARRRDRLPLVVIGPPAPAKLAVSCWFPAPPSGQVLSMLLAELTARPRISSPSWRRKSDMIIGQSVAIRDLLKTLDRVAPSMVNVLISGESGTGKELVARALHYSGPRAAAPFIAINCAAVPESLFEAELFGHVRGAFTGAVAARSGVVESAHGGTLFLDEIGEMPLALQTKLLRVIETRQVTRLGSTEEREVNVRLVTATNRDLGAEVLAGRFREDLLYRIRVFHLTTPPLRERPDDIPPLVNHYLRELAGRDRRPVPAITRAALEKLLEHRWPGNVRELVNALERAMVLAAPGEPIDAAHLPLSANEAPLIRGYREAKDSFEAQYYAQLLRAAGGNVTMAAKLAKRTRAQLYEALRRLDLEPSNFRALGTSRSA